MGGHPYWYRVPYQQNIQTALNQLREREFHAGRYNPVIPFIEFGDDAFLSQNPGNQHRTIEEALEAADADGTRSILDIERVEENPDYSVASPLSQEELTDLFGTDQPTNEMVMGNMDLFENIDRGHCVYIVIYKNGKPDEIFFAGYSFD